MTAPRVLKDGARWLFELDDDVLDGRVVLVTRGASGVMRCHVCRQSWCEHTEQVAEFLAEGGER